MMEKGSSGGSNLLSTVLAGGEREGLWFSQGKKAGHQSQTIRNSGSGHFTIGAYESNGDKIIIGGINEIALPQIDPLQIFSVNMRNGIEN